MKISKREYTTEFKELAVKRVKAGQSAGAAAKDFGLIPIIFAALLLAGCATTPNSNPKDPFESYMYSALLPTVRLGTPSFGLLFLGDARKSDQLRLFC